MVNNVVGIIRDEHGRLEDVTRRSSTDFMYSNELGENVVYSFFEDIDAVPSKREFFEAMIKTVTEKLHEKGIPVKGFIFTKNSVVALQEDDATAFIVDWPSAGNIRKVNVSVATEDMEYPDEDREDDYDGDYNDENSGYGPGGNEDYDDTDGNDGTDDEEGLSGDE